VAGADRSVAKLEVAGFKSPANMRSPIVTSERKRDSNRENSLKSTGPKTERGKQLARFNALKLGIYANSQTIIGEDPALYAANYLKVLDTYQPKGFMEEELCRQITNATWRLRRLESAEVVSLKRTSFSIASSGRLSINRDDEIDHTLIRFLAQERSEDPETNEPPAHPSGELLDLSVGGLPRAPAGFTILKGYTTGSSDPPSREIEALIRVGTVHLLRLHAALEAIQERRRSVTDSISSA
jgi:hypothetical protein